MVSLTPDEIILDVNPRKMVQFDFSRPHGFRFSSSSSVFGKPSNFLAICKSNTIKSIKLISVCEAVQLVFRIYDYVGQLVLLWATLIIKIIFVSDR